MKVKDLIKDLESLNPEAEVLQLDECGVPVKFSGSYSSANFIEEYTGKIIISWDEGDEKSPAVII